MHRNVKVGGKIRKYGPSGSEIVFEDLCTRLNAPLQRAEIFGTTLLIRKGVSGVHRTDHGTFNILSQYTRFSPFHHPQWVEAYWANMHEDSKKKESESDPQKCLRHYKRAYPRPDEFKLLTDERYVECLPVDRFEKAFYLAAVPARENLEKFSAYDPPLSAVVRVEYRRAPIYRTGDFARLESKDHSISIDFPWARHVHTQSERDSGQTFKIPVNTRRELSFSETMAFSPDTPAVQALRYMQIYFMRAIGDGSWF